MRPMTAILMVLACSLAVAAQEEIESTDQELSTSSTSTSTTSSTTTEEEAVTTTTADPNRFTRVTEGRQPREPHVTVSLPIKDSRQAILQRIAEIRAAQGTIPDVESDVCGYSEQICSVEFDSTFDGEPDCCSTQDNPACEKCLTECVKECTSQSKGVSTCFFDESYGNFCECADGPPTCYEIPPGQTTTTVQPEQQPKKGGNITAYLLVLGTLVFGLAAAVHFVYKTG